jgi:hypothetical protein
MAGYWCINEITKTKQENLKLFQKPILLYKFLYELD